MLLLQLLHFLLKHSVYVASVKWRLNTNLSIHEIQESHCHKISPIRSSTLWGLSRSRTEAPLLSLRSCPQWCPRHCTSLYHTLSVLPYQRCKRKPRPNHSQEQEGPLPKWWLILLNAFTVCNMVDVIYVNVHRISWIRNSWIKKSEVSIWSISYVQIRNFESSEL